MPLRGLPVHRRHHDSRRVAAADRLVSLLPSVSGRHRRTSRGEAREGALRRIHHAGFGKDLNGTVDLEITSGDHTIAFLEASFNKVVFPALGPKVMSRPS